MGSAVVPPFGSVDAFDLKPNGARLWKLSDLECAVADIGCEECHILICSYVI